jgi:hypothetical protein
MALIGRIFVVLFSFLLASLAAALAMAAGMMLPYEWQNMGSFDIHRDLPGQWAGLGSMRPEQSGESLRYTGVPRDRNERQGHCYYRRDPHSPHPHLTRPSFESSEGEPLYAVASVRRTNRAGGDHGQTHARNREPWGIFAAGRTSARGRRRVVVSPTFVTRKSCKNRTGPVRSGTSRPVGDADGTRDRSPASSGALWWRV